MIEVSELYNAIQGEGPYMGRPSLFVRFRRCVLSCFWCDSRNTWDADDPEYSNFTTYSSPRDLLTDMIAVAGDLPSEAVVFTGGEPLIYQRDLPWIIEAYAEARTTAYFVPAFEIETAGTIVPSKELLRNPNVRFNVSPKLASSGNEDIPREKLWSRDAARAYFETDATFKLVVGPDDDLSLRLYLSMLSFWAKQSHIPWDVIRRNVYLMPCATTVEELHREQSRILDLAQGLGVRATTRMQIIAYGGERRR